LASAQALQTEGAWLWDQVYGHRSARILIEALDSKVQFSARPGVVSEMQVGA